MFGKITKFAEKAGRKVKSAVGGSTGNGNARNNEMVKEMKAFKEHVKDLVRELQECSQKTTVTNAAVIKVMTQQLPRAYVNGAEGIEAFDTEAHLVGTAVNTEAMAAAVADMNGRIMMEVIKPLEKWLSDFSVTKDKNHKCEALNEELNAQRKTAAAAEDSAKDLQAKNHKNAEAGVHKSAAEKEKERRLEEQFISMEAEIFNEMLESIRAIQDLRNYAHTALQIMQACMAQSVRSFDVSIPVRVRLPSSETYASLPLAGQPPVSVPGGETGAATNPFVGGHPPYPGAPQQYAGAPTAYPGGASPPPPYPGAPNQYPAYAGMPTPYLGPPPAAYSKPAGSYPGENTNYGAPPHGEMPSAPADK